MTGLSLNNTNETPGLAHAARFAAALAAVALVQSLALCWMVYDRVSLIATGREIVLETVPVDPRSLFRGDYVILNYEISGLKLADIGGDKDFGRDDDIFVTLKKGDGGAWQAISASKAYPSRPKEGHVVLRGRARPWRVGDVRVKYGIEAYFVPEGVGKALEEQVRERKLQVLVAVGADGEAAIKGLLVDGELKYEETLF